MSVHLSDIFPSIWETNKVFFHSCPVISRTQMNRNSSKILYLKASSPWIHEFNLGFAVIIVVPPRRGKAVGGLVHWPGDCRARSTLCCPGNRRTDSRSSQHPEVDASGS